jgi:hypothetical protein
MSIIAFIIERRILRAIRRTSREPQQSTRKDGPVQRGNGPLGQT